MSASLLRIGACVEITVRLRGRRSTFVRIRQTRFFEVGTCEIIFLCTFFTCLHLVFLFGVLCHNLLVGSGHHCVCSLVECTSDNVCQESKRIKYLFSEKICGWRDFRVKLYQARLLKKTNILFRVTCVKRRIFGVVPIFLSVSPTSACHVCCSVPASETCTRAFCEQDQTKAEYVRKTKQNVDTTVTRQASSRIPALKNHVR